MQYLIQPKDIELLQKDGAEFGAGLASVSKSRWQTLIFLASNESRERGPDNSWAQMPPETHRPGPNMARNRSSVICSVCPMQRVMISAAAATSGLAPAGPCIYAWKNLKV